MPADKPQGHASDLGLSPAWATCRAGGSWEGIAPSGVSLGQAGHGAAGGCRTLGDQNSPSSLMGITYSYGIFLKTR